MKGLYYKENKIDSINYTFDASGKQVDITWKTYSNKKLGYTIQIPSDSTTAIPDANADSVEIGMPDLLIDKR